MTETASRSRWGIDEPTIPQFPALRVDEAADILDEFVRSEEAGKGIANRFFVWTRENGWQEEVSQP